VGIFQGSTCPGGIFLRGLFPGTIKIYGTKNRRM